MRLRRGGRDRGSMAVEFVIAGPALVVLLLIVSAGGQWLDLTGDVSAAARDSVRAASFARSYQEAEQDAQIAARADLVDVCITPVNPQVEVFTDGVQANDPNVAFATAQQIQVTVSCKASLKVFHLVRYPETETFTDTAVAPLDPFEDR